MVLIRREVHPREKAIPRDRFFVPRDGNPVPREKFPVPRDGIPVPYGTVNFPVIGTVNDGIIIYCTYFLKMLNIKKEQNDEKQLSAS